MNSTTKLVNSLLSLSDSNYIPITTIPTTSNDLTTLPSTGLPIKTTLNKLLSYAHHSIIINPIASTSTASSSTTTTISSTIVEKKERIVTSWKMSDHAYKQDPCPFPTRARGLFTERLSPPLVEIDGVKEEYRIVARGYDKFFSVDEVSWTKVSLYHYYPLIHTETIDN